MAKAPFKIVLDSKFEEQARRVAESMAKFGGSMSSVAQVMADNIKASFDPGAVNLSRALQEQERKRILATIGHLKAGELTVDQVMQRGTLSDELAAIVWATFFERDAEQQRADDLAQAERMAAEIERLARHG